MKVQMLCPKQKRWTNFYDMFPAKNLKRQTRGGHKICNYCSPTVQVAGNGTFPTVVEQQLAMHGAPYLQLKATQEYLPSFLVLFQGRVVSCHLQVLVQVLVLVLLASP